jgi:hypothetical protein
MKKKKETQRLQTRKYIYEKAIMIKNGYFLSHRWNPMTFSYLSQI